MSGQLVLGGAQLSAVPYAHMSSSLERESVLDLVDSALNFGFSAVDCSPNYEGSERWFTLDELNNCQFWTKISLGKKRDVEHIIESIDRSLENARREQIDVLLIHDSDELLQSGQLAQIDMFLESLEREHRVKKIGASIYEEETLNIFYQNYGIDLFQAPANAFDRRFVDLQAQMGLHMVFRSVFLRGLVFSDPLIEAGLRRDALRRLDFACRSIGISMKQFIRLIVDDLLFFGDVVLGFESGAQLRDFFAFKTDQIPEQEIATLIQDLASTDLDLIDPRRW